MARFRFSSWDLLKASLVWKTCLLSLQGGPLPVVSRIRVVTPLIDPLIGGITPVTHLFSAIYRAYTSICKW